MAPSPRPGASIYMYIVATLSFSSSQNLQENTYIQQTMPKLNIYQGTLLNLTFAPFHGITEKSGNKGKEEKN